MTQHARRIAIVSHPWDRITLETLIIGEIAGHLARDWHVTVYGQRGPRQKRRELLGSTIEFVRFTVFRKPHTLLEILVGIVSLYTKRRINLFLGYCYHIIYALRVALNIRLSKCEVVLVFDFLQFAALIKLLNPTATVCLQMNGEWLTYYATAANERRLQAVDLIIGCSHYITDAIKNRFPALAARCHTLHNGVDTDFFCPSPVTTADGTEPLLYIGRLSPEKGVHLLIRTFKILAETRPSLRLHLVGAASRFPYLVTICPDWQDAAIASLEGFYGRRLFDMVRRQLLRRTRSYLDELESLAAGDDRIVFHGGVSNRDTVGLYRRAAMLVFPSVGNETFGVPPIEAMACGLPVVSTYTGGIPETVESGRTGILVPRGDIRELAMAISQLLDNPAMGRAMGNAGRQRVVERFTWDGYARRFADLIESAPLRTARMEIIGRGEKRALVSDQGLE